MHLTTSAADFSKETLVVKEEETHDAGVFEKVEAEVVKRLKDFWNREPLEPCLDFLRKIYTMALCSAKYGLSYFAGK